MKLWDNHMHTDFSGDCRIAPREMMAAARSKGLAGMTVTDHLDLDYVYDPGLFNLDLSDYRNKIRAAASEYSSEHFTVLTGLELGLQPHLALRHAAILKEHSFDYVIGSIHVIRGVDPYYPAFFEGRSAGDAYRDYYATVLENLKAFCDIDALGHLDYVVRYADKGRYVPSYEPFAEEIDAILQFLIQKDIALEINTGAYRCGMDRPNPSPVIIRRYRELGGQLITLGADAHQPSNIALCFAQLPSLLRACGFTEYAVYKGRRPVLYPLPDTKVLPVSK